MYQAPARPTLLALHLPPAPLLGTQGVNISLTSNVLRAVPRQSGILGTHQEKQRLRVTESEAHSEAALWERDAQPGAR